VTGGASSWPGRGDTLSCATGLDCFISASGIGGAAIEATQDGGHTWQPVPLPAVGGHPLALVFPMSCPDPAGCVAVAATAAQFNGSGQKRIIISNLLPAH
jgi:photosystem II stability/assembly factor-like uncharacterized protein